MKTYFEVPTQVAYWDESHYVGGIAYHDMIICGCCGGLMEIKEVIEFAPVDVTPVIEYAIWNNVSSEIMDEEAEYFRLKKDEEEEEE
jgi:hypothetical protein